MRKLSIFLAFILVVTFGQASLFAQTCEITVDNISNSWDGGTKLNASMVHHAGLRVNASCLPTYDPGTGPQPSRYNVTNTILVYSPDDLAEWNYTIGSLLPTWLSLGWTGTVYIHFHKVSGTGVFDFLGYTGPIPNPDTEFGDDSVAITFGGSTTWEGLTLAFNEVAWDIQFQSRLEDEGDFICFDSVSEGLAGGSAWKWAPLTDPEGDVFPVWQGPYCYEVSEMPNEPPYVDNDPGHTLSFSHCAEGSIDFTATEEENDIPYVWEVMVGPGIMTSTGPKAATWSWSGGEVPQCSDNTVIEVRARDDIGTDHWGPTYTVNITITNEAPEFSAAKIGPVLAATGSTTKQLFSVSDACMDPMAVTVLDNGGAEGAVDADLDSVWFTPTENDVGTVTMFLLVCDEVDQGCGLCDTLEVEWTVSVGGPVMVVIEKDEGQTGEGALQGMITEVSVSLEKNVVVCGLSGFDFRFAYDASVLSFQGADPADGLIGESGCDWEYFTYRQGSMCSGCQSGCPSGEAHVISMAELNNGASHPVCDAIETPGLLFDLLFLVSNNRTYECQFAPVRFFWCDCTDNTLSNCDGSVLLVSGQVFDFDGTTPPDGYRRIDTVLFDYPTFYGYQPHDECLGGKVDVEKWADMKNGGVDIVCGDEIDARGDINLNGIAYEIADAVMFTNYFIMGLTAFGPIGSMQVQASIAASDANADGIPLSVADLVYLIRVVIGDALAYPKVNPTHATFSHENDVVSVSGEMGAAFIVVEGKVTPTLLAGNMELKYGYSDQNTRILVYSHQGGKAFSGEFLRTEGEIISIDFATYEGQPVEARNVPRTFSVSQNYPNPFNAETVIKFAMPNAGDWRVSIYNVTGQLVEEFSGSAEAGEQTVRWDATGRASGIYFYKVVAGNQTETKKAVYLK